MIAYSYQNWGITEAEYEMLQQAKQQGIVTDRQIEDCRYSFIWGEETVASFINRLDWGRRFVTDIIPTRDYIGQREFEDICREVVAEYPDVRRLSFAPMEFHFSFPSHSGKSLNGGGLYFDDDGYITGKNWKYSDAYGTNLPRIIGKRISNKIKSALYA